MFDGVDKKRKAVFFGLLFSLAATMGHGLYQEYAKNAADLSHKREKKEAKQKLAVDYGTSALKSQAVFLLPPPGEDDGYWKVRPYLMRDQLEKNGIRAFVIGDTSGHATVSSIQDDIKKIQKEHCFSAVTVLSLTHGGVFDTQTGKQYDSTTTVKQWDAWDKNRDKTGHGTIILRDGYQPYTHDLMKAMSDAAQVKKMDWVSFSCFSGAMDQNKIDVLPPGSTFVALSGGGQVNYFNAQDRMLKDMTENKMQFDEGVDGTDFLVEALKENWREYNADIVIGVSGSNAPAVIPSDNRYNHRDNLGAQTTNAQQMERVKKIKIKKNKQPRPR